MKNLEELKSEEQRNHTYAKIGITLSAAIGPVAMLAEKFGYIGSTPEAYAVLASMAFLTLLMPTTFGHYVASNMLLGGENTRPTIERVDENKLGTAAFAAVTSAVGVTALLLSFNERFNLIGWQIPVQMERFTLMSIAMAFPVIPTLLFGGFKTIPSAFKFFKETRRGEEQPAPKQNPLFISKDEKSKYIKNFVNRGWNLIKDSIATKKGREMLSNVGITLASLAVDAVIYEKLASFSNQGYREFTSSLLLAIGLPVLILGLSIGATRNEIINAIEGEE